MVEMTGPDTVALHPWPWRGYPEGGQKSGSQSQAGFGLTTQHQPTTVDLKIYRDLTVTRELLS